MGIERRNLRERFHEDYLSPRASLAGFGRARSSSSQIAMSSGKLTSDAGGLVHRYSLDDIYQAPRLSLSN